MRKTLMSVLNLIVLIFVGYYVYDVFQSNKNDLISISWNVNIWCIGLSFLFLVLDFFALASGWYLLTRIYAFPVGYKKTVMIWFQSQLGKYIPGKIWMYLSRGSYYANEKDGKFKYTCCVLLEGIYSLMSALIVFVISLFFITIDYIENETAITLGLLVVLLVMIHPSIINFGLRKINSLLKKHQFPLLQLKYYQMLLLSCFWIVSTVFGGISLYFMTKGISIGLPSEAILYYAAVNALAGFIGLISVFAPSGIGVREGVYMLMLTKYISTMEATIVSLLSRVWFTAIELILIGAVWIWWQMKKGRKNEESFQGLSK